MAAVRTLALAFAALLAWGQGAPERARSEAAKRPPSDAALQAAIRARFARSKIAVNGFTVRVRDGVAILEGKTDVAQHKGVATRLARLAGARRVENRIRVSERAREKARRSRRPPRRVHVRWTERSKRR